MPRRFGQLTSVVLALILTIVPARADDEINDVMKRISNVMLQLLPEMNAPLPNHTSILRSVRRLEKLLQDAGPHLQSDDLNRQVAWQMLNDRLGEVTSKLDGPSQRFVRSALNQAFESCADCHASDRISRPAFGVSRLSRLDEFSAAEFSYLTRDYDAAIVSYKNVLGNSDDKVYRVRALERLLTITAQIRGDVATGATLFASLADKSGDAREREQLHDWAQALTWLDGNRKSPGSPYLKRNIAEMAAWLESDWPTQRASLDWPAQQVWWVVIQGELNQLLASEHPPQDTPTIVYWLAVADRSLHYRYYNSLSRYYLEQCITAFPAHTMAPMCLDELELMMIVSYSGSAGINLPDEVRDEIEALRRLVSAARPEPPKS